MFRPVHLSVLITFAVLAIGTGFYYQNKNHTLVEPASAEVAELGEKILTAADFDVYGRTDQTEREKNHLRVSINPDVPPFDILVNSWTLSTRGGILIYQNNQNTILQTIDLPDPNMYLADRVHEFFNVTDINFDGYADIGVLVEGGAKWGAYQYWTFDTSTGLFVSSTFTDQFRQLNFNALKFNTEKKQITTNNFCGTLACDTDLYEVQNNELKLIEAKHQEQSYSPANDGTPLNECTETITTYGVAGKKVETKITAALCKGYYWE